MWKRHKPEEIIGKLRQVEVMTGQGTSMADAYAVVIEIFLRDGDNL